MRVGTVLILTFALVMAGCGSSGNHSKTNPASSSSLAPRTAKLTPDDRIPVAEDAFNESTLDSSRWAFVDPVGGATTSMDGTHAEIHVPAGEPSATRDPDAPGDNAPRVMQDVRAGDFSFDVKFDSEVTQEFQEQGVVVEQDSTHYLYAKIVRNRSQTAFVVQAVSGGIVATWTNMQIYNRPAINLRVTHTGDQWNLGFSYDGLYWTAASAFSRRLEVRRVGVFGGNDGATAPAFTARIDSFRNTAPSTTAPVINIWYGPNQTYGKLGQPQTWVNVLGDVVAPAGLAGLTYSLNGSEPETLAMGENETRLVAPGEFNAEIAYTELHAGANSFVLSAIDNDGKHSTSSVTLVKAPDTLWPLPYTADWSKAGGNPDTVAQVADGHWVVHPDGTIRNSDVGYDRIVTLGQADAWSTYTATAEVTIHSMDSDGSAVGLIAGFEGATSDVHGTDSAVRPRIGHSFPAAFLYDNAAGKPRHVEIYTNTDTRREQTLVADTTNVQLAIDVAYTFKVNVTDNSAGGSLYRFKVWKTGTAEPAPWLVQGISELGRGSIALVAHHADVSFGTVHVAKP